MRHCHCNKDYFQSLLQFYRIVAQRPWFPKTSFLRINKKEIATDPCKKMKKSYFSSLFHPPAILRKKENFSIHFIWSDFLSFQQCKRNAHPHSRTKHLDQDLKYLPKQKKKNSKINKVEYLLLLFFLCCCYCCCEKSFSYKSESASFI